MTHPTTSRINAPIGLGQPSLATVLERILADEAISERPRQAMASALRTTAKAIGRPLAEIRAQPVFLRDQLKAFAPVMIGISEARWSNVLSLLRAALEHAGVSLAARGYKVAFAPAWTRAIALMAQKHDAISLSRLARFCTSRDIPPEAVDDAVFGAFLAHLESDTLVKLPKKVHRRAVVVWNLHATTTSGWPGRSVTLPNNSRVYALPWSTFPATLQAEYNDYIAGLSDPDPLSDFGFRRLRPASIRARRLQLGAYVSALVHQGRAPETLICMRDLFDINAIKSGLRFFMDRGPDGSTKQAASIAGMLHTVAGQIGVSVAQCDAIRRLVKKLEQPQVGMTDKNRDRLRAFDDPETVAALLLFPEKLVAAVEAIAKPGHAEALLVQTAVMVEILTMLPLRRHNLASLEVKRHFLRSRTGTVVLHIPGSEVKNGQSVEGELPYSSVVMLDLYLSKYRPLLLSEPSLFLFPGVADRPKSRERVAHQVVETIKERCGITLHLHLFRHIGAKLFLDQNPGAYGVVKTVQGHKTEATTTSVYCGMEAPAAFRSFDSNVLDLRQALKAGEPVTRNPLPPATRGKPGRRPKAAQ